MYCTVFRLVSTYRHTSCLVMPAQMSRTNLYDCIPQAHNFDIEHSENGAQHSAGQANQNCRQHCCHMICQLGLNLQCTTTIGVSATS